MKRKQHPTQTKEKIVHGGEHKVKQPGSGESQITDADLAEFNRLKSGGDATARDAFRFITKQRRVGKDNNHLNMAADMRLHPQKYGFADSAAAAAWQGEIELADE